MKINRSITEPLIRSNATWEERWNCFDKGLITAWETGRIESHRDLQAATRAKQGELVILPWKGGVEKSLKVKQKFGTLLYLAMWQGLRGDDLDVDTELEPLLICSTTKMAVTFTGDVTKYADA